MEVCLVKESREEVINRFVKREQPKFAKRIGQFSDRDIRRAYLVVLLYIGAIDRR